MRSLTRGYLTAFATVGPLSFEDVLPRELISLEFARGAPAQDLSRSVRRELYGLPRLPAERPDVEVQAAILREEARALASAAPSLVDPVLDEEGWLVDGYAFVVDERFTREAATPVTPRSSVLLVASQAGG